MCRRTTRLMDADSRRREMRIQGLFEMHYNLGPLLHNLSIISACVAMLSPSSHAESITSRVSHVLCCVTHTAIIAAPEWVFSLLKTFGDQQLLSFRFGRLLYVYIEASLMLQ